MTKYYTAVGEVKLPEHMKPILHKIAAGLADDQFTLRTNGFYGMAEEMQKGVNNQGELYLPWQTFNNKHSVYNKPCEKAYDVGLNYVHRFGYKSKKAQKVIAANISSLLGDSCNNPSSFALLYMFEDSEQEYMKVIAHEYQIEILDLTVMNSQKLQAGLGV